jgi:hypothetical protein
MVYWVVKMFNAKQAKENADKVNEERTLVALQSVLDEIESCSKMGLYATNIELEDSVRIKLESLGFECDPIESDYNEEPEYLHDKISWN